MEYCVIFPQELALGRTAVFIPSVKPSDGFLLECVSTFRSAPDTVAQWDSPMQVKLSCWKLGLNTLLVELLPWALLANHSQWDLWLFEGETIVLQIPAGRIIVPPNFKVQGRLVEHDITNCSGIFSLRLLHD